MESNHLKIICFIDDDMIYQFTAKRIVHLINPMQPVLVFPTGKEAIDFFTENAQNAELLPDIVLVDINMPIMNGWEFLEAYNELKNKLAKCSQLYMVSSTVDDKEKARSRTFHVKEFLVKPLNQKTIADILTEPAYNS